MRNVTLGTMEATAQYPGHTAAKSWINSIRDYFILSIKNLKISWDILFIILDINTEFSREPRTYLTSDNKLSVTSCYNNICTRIYTGAFMPILIFIVRTSQHKKICTASRTPPPCWVSNYRKHWHPNVYDLYPLSKGGNRFRHLTCR